MKSLDYDIIKNLLDPIIDRGINYKLYNSKSNFRVLLIPNDKYTSINAKMYIKVGSIFENDSNRGIAHVMEHMIFKGTRNYPNIDIKLDSIGAQYNASTSYEKTIYYINALSIYDNLIVDIILDILFNPIFPIDQINKELQVVIQELLIKHDNKIWLALNNLIENITVDDRYKIPPIGLLETIKKITREDLIKFHKYYITDLSRNILVIYGRFDENKIINLIENKLNESLSICDHKFRENNRFINNRKNNINVISKKLINNSTNTTTIFLGFLSPPYNIKYDIILLLINIMLSDGISSRLFKLLRIRNNIAYTFDSGLITFDNWGLEYISITCESKKIKKVYKLLIEELNIIKINRFSKKELDYAKDKLYTKLLISYNDPINISEHYLYYIINNYKIITIKEYFNMINCININQIMTIYELIFNLNISLCSYVK